MAIPMPIPGDDDDDDDNKDDDDDRWNNTNAGIYSA
jgi:hypothetical protein